jgi:hypothetical protein
MGLTAPELCPTARTISVPFDLPETGDVTAYVPIR